MKSDEIRSLFSQFEAAASDLEGVECWSARELQNLLGYSKWENFEKVIQKAKDACSNAGEIIENHFPDIRKMVEIGSNTERPPLSSSFECSGNEVVRLSIILNETQNQPPPPSPFPLNWPDITTYWLDYPTKIAIKNISLCLG